MPEHRGRRQSPKHPQWRAYPSHAAGRGGWQQAQLADGWGFFRRNRPHPSARLRRAATLPRTLRFAEEGGAPLSARLRPSQAVTFPGQPCASGRRKQSALPAATCPGAALSERPLEPNTSRLFQLGESFALNVPLFCASWDVMLRSGDGSETVRWPFRRSRELSPHEVALPCMRSY